MEAQLHDFVYPAHSHDHVCIGLMLDGEKSSRYGLRRHTVKKGDVMLVNPGEVHDGRPSGSCDRRYSMLEIDPITFRQACFAAIGKDWVEFQQPVQCDEKIRRAVSSWLKSLNGTDVFAEGEAMTMLLGLVSAQEDNLRDQKTGELASKIRDRMLENPSNTDSIGALAMEIGASRYQLIRGFRQAFGLTPEDFRRQLRVQRARCLLAGRQRLADIAADAGFADQSHMTREFRRLVGLTPAAYRRAMQ